MKKNSLEDYLSRNYPIELIPDKEEGGYFAQHPDLDGCAAQGETAEEAVANLDVARQLWIEVRWEDDLPIPDPLPQELSGRMSLRMMPALHAQLARLASRQDVSLNLLLNTILAERSGYAMAEGQVLEAIRGLRPPTPTSGSLKSWDDLPVVLRAARELFRQGERILARELLEILPEPRKSSFMLGMLFLSEGSAEAFRHCAVAYGGGLTDIEATTVYQCIPSFSQPEALKSLMLHVCTSPSAGEFGEAEIRLAGWLEKARDNYRRAQEWEKDISEEFTEWMKNTQKGSGAHMDGAVA